MVAEADERGDRGPGEGPPGSIRPTGTPEPTSAPANPPAGSARPSDGWAAGRREVLLGGTGLATAALLSGCGAQGKDGGPGPSPSPSAASRSPRPSGPPPPATEPDWAALAGGLDGDLVRPGADDYDRARRLYNPRFDSVRPAGIAYCTRPEDVRECIGFARRTRLPLAVRSGGHSYTGWSTGTGLVVDVSRMDGVSLSGGTATAGPGARLMSLYDRLADDGVTVPGGSCPTVAISGLTLGGGHGVVSRAYGLTCDNLISARIVLADGRIVECDAEREKDLFWALRGAGNGNFGVVTSLRFRTRPAAECTVFRVTWSWRRAGSALRTWQEWGPNAPDELWSNLHLGAGSGGDPTVSAGGLQLGDAASLRGRVDELIGKVGPAATVSVRTMSYLEAMYYMAGCSELTSCLDAPRESYTSRSDFFDEDLGTGGLDALLGGVRRAQNLTGKGSGAVLLTALGGAVNRVAPEATAFVHRRSRFLAQYLASWPDTADGSTVSRYSGWLDELHGSMRRHASGAAYQNYPDAGLKDWRRAYYGAHAERLAKLKSRYDPERLFRYPQAL